MHGPRSNLSCDFCLHGPLKYPFKALRTLQIEPYFARRAPLHGHSSYLLKVSLEYTTRPSLYQCPDVIRIPSLLNICPDTRRSGSALEPCSSPLAKCSATYLFCSNLRYSRNFDFLSPFTQFRVCLD